MNPTFAAVLVQVLGPDFAWKIANGLRPQERLLFARLLPEMPKNSFHVQDGTMTIRATMAGLAAMDSPYPPGGLIESSTFLSETGKIANEVTLTEKARKELHAILANIQLASGDTTQALVDEVLNFTEKVVVQPHIDTMEYLRGRALGYGEIDWTYNNVELKVDYGFSAGHLFDTRTGNDGYGGSASTFWADDRAAQKLLRYRSGLQRIMHSDTWDVVINNPVNMIEVTASAGNSRTIRRLVTRGGNTQFSSDARDQMQVTLYDEEGELLNPADTTKTVRVPFLDPGRIIYATPTADDGYRVGQGATDDAEDMRTLGYTHIAPTVEGMNQGLRGGGRWSQVFTPERMPMQLTGQGVTNGLPVIENPDRVVVTSTVMP